MKNADILKYNDRGYSYETFKNIKMKGCEGILVPRYNKNGICSRSYNTNNSTIETTYNKRGIPLSQIIFYFDGSVIESKFVYKKDKLCKICRDFSVATDLDKIRSSVIETEDRLGRFKYDSTEFITENIKLRKTEYSSRVFRDRLYNNDEIIIDFIDNPILENVGFKFYLPKEELEKLLGKKFISYLIYHTPFTWTDDFIWSSEYWAHETTIDYWKLRLHRNRGED